MTVGQSHKLASIRRPGDTSRHYAPGRAGRSAAFVCILMLMSAACSDGTGPSLDRNAVRTELQSNEQRWAEHGIDDYDFHFRRVCDCPESSTTPVRIEVRDGAVMAVRLLSTGAQLNPGAGDWPSIPQLFNEVRLALDEGAAGVEVAYDPVYGYPLQLRIRWSASMNEVLECFASNLVPVSVAAAGRALPPG